MVRIWLLATISSDLMTEIQELPFAYPMWQRLLTRFNMDSLARVVELKRALSNCRKLESQSMSDYLRNIKMIADSLVVIRYPVADLELINDTIAGLDEAYDNLVSVIEYTPGSLITFDDLRTRLLMFE